MASVVRLTAITNYFKDESYRLAKGEDAVHSGHIMSCNIDREKNCLWGKVQASFKKEHKNVKVLAICM